MTKQNLIKKLTFLVNDKNMSELEKKSRGDGLLLSFINDRKVTDLYIKATR